MNLQSRPLLLILRSLIVVAALVMPGTAEELAAPAQTIPWWSLLKPVHADKSDEPLGPSHPVQAGDFAGSLEEWHPLFKGIDYARARADAPRSVRVHGIRIDLAEPTIDFLATPSNGDRPKDTDGAKTTAFLKAQGCQLAINASAFEPFDPHSSAEGAPLNILGLSMSRGDCYSPAQAGHAALLIAKDHRAWVEEAQEDRDKAFNAVAGFGLLLKDGANVASQDETHPRTAAGVSQDGQYLYLMVIDGRQPGYSEGTTTRETAEWIKALGAYNAVNLDGGGSTALVISDGQGGAKVLNRPIHMKIPGMERPVGNHLGVFAQPVATP